MSLSKFINSIEVCPICGEPLSVYMQTIDGPLWKASPNLRFRQFKCKSPKLKNDSFKISCDEVCELDFSSNEFSNLAKTWSVFFFKMCGDSAIKDVAGNDYKVNPYFACYFIATSFLEFDENSPQWTLKLCPGAEVLENDINDEIFIIKRPWKDNLEKVYVLNMDYNQKVTILRQFVCNPVDMLDDDYEPDMFRKDLPLLPHRPDISIQNRDKLIDRLDSWILLS